MHSDFLSQKRLLEYLNNILLPSLRENEEIHAQIGSTVKFIVNMLPITLKDVAIPNERGPPEIQKYLTNFVNSEIAKFKSQLNEELRKKFERLYEPELFTKLYQILDRGNYKKLSGITFIHCNEPKIIKILLNKDLNGNDHFVRDFSLKEDGTPYTQEDVNSFSKERLALIPNLINIDLTYNEMPQEIYPVFFNFKAEESNDSPKGKARFEICNVFSSITNYINSLGKSSFNLDEFVIEVPDYLNIFSFDFNQDLPQLINLYSKNLSNRNNSKVFKSSFFLEMLKKKLNDLKSQNNFSKQIVRFDTAWISDPEENKEELFYLQRANFSDNEIASNFMKKLLEYISRKSRTFPKIPDYVIFDFSSLHELCDKIFNKPRKIAKESDPFISYLTNISSFRNTVRDLKDKLNSEINNIFGPLKSESIVPIPGISLNEEEKLWIEKTIPEINEKIKLASNENKPNEEESLKKGLISLNPNKTFKFLFSEFLVNKESPINGDLFFVIENTKIPYEGNYVLCTDLIVAGKSKVIIDFFTERFSQFTQNGRSVEVSVENRSDKRGLAVFLSIRVRFESKDDAYDATKFCTYFSVRPDIPDDDDNLNYIVRWDKTKDQAEALAGVGGEQTLKLYKESEGLRLDYPFVENTYKVVINRIFKQQLDRLNMYNAPVRTLTRPKTEVYNPNSFEGNLGVRSVKTEQLRSASASLFAQKNRALGIGVGAVQPSTNSFIKENRIDKEHNVNRYQTNERNRRSSSVFVENRAPPKRVTPLVTQKGISFSTNKYAGLFQEDETNNDLVVSNFSSELLKEKINKLPFKTTIIKNDILPEGFISIGPKGKPIKEEKERQSTPGKYVKLNSQFQSIKSPQRFQSPQRFGNFRNNERNNKTPGRNTPERYQRYNNSRSPTNYANEQFTPNQSQDARNIFSSRSGFKQRINYGPIVAKSYARGPLPKGPNSKSPKFDTFLPRYPVRDFSSPSSNISTNSRSSSPYNFNSSILNKYPRSSSPFQESTKSPSSVDSGKRKKEFKVFSSIPTTGSYILQMAEKLKEEESAKIVEVPIANNFANEDDESHDDILITNKNDEVKFVSLSVNENVENDEESEEEFNFEEESSEED